MKEGKAEGAANGTSAARTRRAVRGEVPRAPDPAARLTAPPASESVPSDVLASPTASGTASSPRPTFHPVDHVGGFVEITDGVGFCPSFANVSVLRHRRRPGPRRHRAARRWPRWSTTTSAAGAPPASTPRSTPTATSTTSSGCRSGRRRRPSTGLGGARGHRPPRAARALRPLHLHRGVQHDHQPPPVRLHRPGLADRVPLPGPHLPRHARTSRSAASTSRCATRRARPTTTPITWQPDSGCSVLRRPVHLGLAQRGQPPEGAALPREWADALRRMLGPRRRVPPPRPRVPRRRGRPGPPGPHRHRATSSTPWSTRRSP